MSEACIEIGALELPEDGTVAQRWSCCLTMPDPGSIPTTQFVRSPRDRMGFLHDLLFPPNLQRQTGL